MLWANKSNDDYNNYFATVDCAKNIECIMPATEMTISFLENGLRANKVFNIYAEKIDSRELIQLRLTEKSDARQMYITTVDNASFHDLKQEQSLHVTFIGFVENLVHMLKECQNGKLELNLVRKDCAESINGNVESNNYQLQFVEKRPFKNLVHLCLPCRSAPLSVVLFYINNMLQACHKISAVQEQNNELLKHELNTQQRRFEQLLEENQKLRESIIDNKRKLNEQHAQQIQQIQDKLQKITEQRNSDCERNRKMTSGLQIQLDKLEFEKTNLKAEKEQEQKRTESLKEELANIKSRISTLKEQNERLHADITTMKNYERKQNISLDDAKKQIVELQEKVKQTVKEKANITAELQAEKKILHTKRQALEMATEEISKANQIILKQNQDLIKHRKIIDLRTEVALQQEKAMREKECQIQMRDEEIKHMRKTIDSLQKEIPQQLDSMRKFAHDLELKYKNEIKSLQDKLASIAVNEGYNTNRRN